jgi:release factor glutamine methyltransferase
MTTVARLSPPEVDLLRAHVLRRSYAWVVAHPEARLTRPQQRRLQRLLAQRRRAKPLAYLTGTKEFYGRTFIVTPAVLVPRPETEHLVETALKLPLSPAAAVADVGTGSGCIAVTLALERLRWRLIATDASGRALAVARKNIERYHLKPRISVFHGDLIAPVLRQHQPVDLVIANLPYARPEEYHAVAAEPRRAIVGGNDGLAVFRRFFRQLARSTWPAPVILEIDPRRRAAVIAVARQHLGQVSIRVSKDLAGHDRVLTIRPGATA